MASMDAALSHTVELTGLRYGWQPGTPLLDIELLQVARGERLFIYGPSGSGKSTLLSLLGGLISPQQGQIRILGQAMTELGASARDRFRADHLGFVFQQFNLIPYLDPVDNITLALSFSRHRRRQLGGESPRQAAQRLLKALELDPDQVAGQPARQLSIGQQQRVAVARALIGKPELIIADEPTSSLDADSQARFLTLLFDQCRSQNSTLVFVSHDLRLAEQFDRTLSLEQINRASTSRPPKAVAC
ncbi:ATP-binding cassette domain-containing protein [Motiliproteus sp.]|uniref:ATP-binding cassette domain-containing protein n=1 Tax=Motiliproteus sp. TaxID=1898955 RepID=UPI003BAB3AD8